MSYARSTWLVTGATGFIGRRVVDRLTQEDIVVHCLASPERLQSRRLPVSPSIVPVDVDLTNLDQLRGAVERVKPEVVINLAAKGVDPLDRDRQLLLSGNVGVLAKLLESLAGSRPRLVVHMGSWSEYKDPGAETLITEDHPVLPTSLYGAAKAAATIYGNALARQLAIPFVVLRLFNVYGVGERDQRLIPYLIDCLGRDEPALLTPGDQTRDFLYVDDVVEAILRAANAERMDPAVYNVCSGRPVDVRLVAETTASIMGKSTELLHFGARPSRLDEPLWMVGDNDRFTATTYWRPQISLEEGIIRMVEARKASDVSVEEV